MHAHIKINFDVKILVECLFEPYVFVNYRDQPKAGTGHKMLSVSFVFSTSRFQGPAFGCDKIVVIVTLLEAIEGIPGKDYNFLGNDKFPNLYERLLHEQKLKSRYLERRIYERPLKSELLSRIKAKIFQNYFYINTA